MNIINLKRNSIKLLFTLIIFKFAISQSVLFAQTFVQDTLFISIRKPNETKPSTCVIDTVIDQRSEHPRVLGIFEKNRYIFIPVDLVMVAEKPLTTAIYENLQMQTDGNDSPGFRLVLYEFSLKKKSNWLFYHRYILNASVNIFKCKDGDQQEYAGQLLYESTFNRLFFSGKLKRGIESVIGIWQRELAEDLSKLSANHSSRQTSKLHNLRTKPYEGKVVNLHSGVDYIVGSNGTIIEWELLFSHREARKKFIRNGYTVRYRNEKKFDAIEFGLIVDNLFYRLNSKVMFRVKSQLLLGFNRWNDVERTQRKLYDAFIGDYALSQSVMFNPLDRKSLVIGLGLSESINYIYTRGIKLNIGFLINAGIKL